LKSYLAEPKGIHHHSDVTVRLLQGRWPRRWRIAGRADPATMKRYRRAMVHV
jgi:hypothetical protein